MAAPKGQKHLRSLVVLFHSQLRGMLGLEKVMDEKSLWTIFMDLTAQAQFLNAKTFYSLFFYTAVFSTITHIPYTVHAHMGGTGHTWLIFSRTLIYKVM